MDTNRFQQEIKECVEQAFDREREFIMEFCTEIHDKPRLDYIYIGSDRCFAGFTCKSAIRYYEIKCIISTSDFLEWLK